MSEPQKNQIRLLAEAFKRRMLEELGPEKLAIAVSVNQALRKAGRPNVCATHDFCDANMPMHEAFQEAMGYDPLDANDETDGGMNQSDTLLWGAAWELAKIEEFVPHPEWH